MESMSRISSILDAARELTIEAGALKSARNGPGSSRLISAAQIKKLLDSKHEREVLDGLRRVIAMDYKSLPTLRFFTPIIKNIASPSLDVKKLVYTYLLAHAEAEPQNALMSINTIVRSLSDPNPSIRALALRVVSGIRVPEVSQIVALYIRRSAGDMSPVVRRAAALAIPKCYRLDPQQLPQLVEHLDVLMGDKQYHVAAAAVMSFNATCPDRLDLVHKHYRGLIRKLVDMDEWGQLAMLDLMVRYVRRCFPRRTRRVARLTGDKALNADAANLDRFYNENGLGQDDSSQMIEEEVVLDPDLSLLLRALQPLLNSRNSAVILSVAKSYMYLAPPPPQSDYLTNSIPQLIALLRGPLSERAVALTSIVQICLACPQPFLPYYTRFLISNEDTPETRRLKLEVLTLLFPHASPAVRGLMLAELAHFSRSADPSLVRDAVRALGRCAQASSGTAEDKITNQKCLQLLLAQLSSPHSTLVAESLEVIRHLIQRDPEAHRGTVVQLARNLDSLTAPQARASIIWLVGEFSPHSTREGIAADVLRILLKNFANEEEGVKMQIVLLGAKVYLNWLNEQNTVADKQPETQNDTAIDMKPASTMDTEQDGWAQSPQREGADNAKVEVDKPIQALWTYVLLLARYDTSYDLRDRARLYKNLLLNPASTSLAALMLLAPKPVPHVPSPSENAAGYALGTASLVLGSAAGLGAHGLSGYETIPDWVHAGEEPDPRSRDSGGLPTTSATGAGLSISQANSMNDIERSVGSGKSNGTQPKTLDDWLNEDDGDQDSGHGAKELQEQSEEESSEYEEVTDSEAETDESDDERGEHVGLVS